MKDLRTLGHAALLGAMTGIRSTAGPAALARELGNRSWWTKPRGGVRGWLADDGVETALTALAIGEMVVDKVPGVPSRTQPLPLAGRAAIGAVLGALVAGRRADVTDRVVTGLVGASAAVLSATLATRLRVRADDRGVPDPILGLIEDAVVTAAARGFGDG